MFIKVPDVLTNGETIKINPMDEVWKNIPDYEGKYMVSNIGRVKSLPRKFRKKEMILKSSINKYGYYVVSLYDKKINTIAIHLLMARAFLNHKKKGNKYVVDHKDDNKLNNVLENLQIVTARFNVSKNRKSTSKYTGVSWNKRRKKWYCQIRINKKDFKLGYFDNELEASKAYQEKLKEIQK